MTTTGNTAQSILDVSAKVHAALANARRDARAKPTVFLTKKEFMQFWEFTDTENRYFDPSKSRPNMYYKGVLVCVANGLFAQLTEVFRGLD